MIRAEFGVYKSNVCHYLKSYGDIGFLIDVLEKDEIRKLFDRKWYPEALYLLAMVDYISRLNNVPLCTNYDDIRCCKLQEIIYPMGCIILDSINKNDEEKNEAIKNAIPEFLKFNIVECDVRDVC